MGKEGMVYRFWGDHKKVDYMTSVRSDYFRFCELLAGCCGGNQE